MKISILDYGMGNIKSVMNGLESLGAETKIIDDPNHRIEDKLIIPGVGAWGDAVDSLKSFVPVILGAVESDIPILGICLGMQLFFEGSEESLGIEGLGILDGRVTKLKTDLNLPHIGWNSLEIKKEDCPIFRGINGGFVYYANSYHARPSNDITSAVSDYGTEITASVWKGEIYGTQFHPEKSGKLGLKILQNFLEM